MVTLRETRGGVHIRLCAQPKASRNAVVGMLGDRVKVAVTTAPTDGKANKAIEALLAKALAVRPSAVSIVAGHASRHKTARVEGLAAKDVQARLLAIITDGAERHTA
ncbi:DUF167 domain-containing protein [bacterium]|nr:DUF167 domain-containing protein [bacterium]